MAKTDTLITTLSDLESHDRPLDVFTNTLSGYGLTTPVARALVLTIFSGPGKYLPTGGRDRGRLHAYLCTNPVVDRDRALDHLMELAPNGTTYHTTAVSREGLIARLTETGIEPGLTLQPDRTHLTLKDVAYLDTHTRVELTSLLTATTHRIAKGGETAEFSPRQSLIASDIPQHNTFDSAVPIIRQLPIDDDFLSALDLVCVQESPGTIDLETTATVSASTARDYVTRARSRDPELTTDAAEHLTEHAVSIAAAYDHRPESSGDPFAIAGSDRMVRLTLDRVAAAVARCRLHSRVTVADARTACDLYTALCDPFDITPVQDECDDIEVCDADTPYDKSRAARVVAHLETVVEDDSRSVDDGVPFARLDADLDMTSDDLAELLTTLKYHDRIYEPVKDQYLPIPDDES